VTSVIDNLDTFRNTAGGTIRLTDGAAGDVFQVATSTSGAGNFVANGGTVALDVVLGGDGSSADRLDISGDVILDGAPTALAFTVVGGGAGGETTTGIEVVTVGGTSDDGAFVLASPLEVGAIAYDLSRGQCDDTANDNWYLCSTIGTTGAVFEAMPGIILNTFARSETLQQRLGARVTSREMATVTASSRGASDLPVAQTVGPWVRSWGDFAQITPDTSTAGTRWEADNWGFEAGIGSILGDHAGGRLVGGINLRYGTTNANLSNQAGTASFDSEGFGLAASLTWFGNDGFYVDGNAAVDFVSIDATSQGGGLLLDGHDDVVYSASFEVGQRIELQGGTTLVPQAQLSWGRMRDGTLTDSLGNVVSFADRETLTSRIGLTVEQDLGDTDLGSGTVFAFANVLNDLSGSRTVTVAGTDLTQSGTGDWLELGGGFSVQSSETTNLFGQVSYREAFDGVRGDAVAVSAGLRMQW
jgi:fibronectin-binding autotransporter adhesin